MERNDARTEWTKPGGGISSKSPSSILNLENRTGDYYSEFNNKKRIPGFAILGECVVGGQSVVILQSHRGITQLENRTRTAAAVTSKSASQAESNWATLCPP